MPAWSWWWAPIRCGSSPRVELGADASDDDRGIARPHAGRAEDDDAVPHARVVGMDRRVAVLQAFDERAGGQAEHALVDRELDRRRAFVFLVDHGDHRAVHSLKAVSVLLAGREPAPAPLLRILLEEELERGEEADDLLLAALRRAPDAACRKAGQLVLVEQTRRRAPLLEIGVVVELLERCRLDELAPAGEDARGLGPADRLAAREGDEVGPFGDETLQVLGRRQLTGRVDDQPQAVPAGEGDDLRQARLRVRLRDP